MKHFIDISNLSKEKLISLLNSSIQSKNRSISKEKLYKVIGLFFEKNSTRTRLSFELAINQLGSSSTFISSKDSHFGWRKESLEDTAKTFALYLDAVVMRVKNHNTLINFAENSSIPIINGLSDLSHPCQTLAGLMTLIEEKGSLDNLNLVWLGPITNVAHSWIEAYKLKLGFNLNIFCPEVYSIKYLNKLQSYDLLTDLDNIVVHNIDHNIINSADAILTDTWKSMGEEINDDELHQLEKFCVTEELFKKAKKDCIFMHCLPASRGQEVEEKVIDGPNSRIWIEAKNRLFVQKQLLKDLL